MDVDLIVQYESLRDEFYELEPGSSEFIEVFSGIKSLAENGLIEAVGLVAEMCAFEPSVHDPESAYKFYNIGKHEEDGALIEFKNISDCPGYYQGVSGDFRNDSQVAELVLKLGFETCQRLDEEANRWRAKYL